MKRLELYKKIIKAVLGREIADGRKREDVAARMCLAYQLHEDGYTSGQVGKMIGRDHATVLHMIKMMDACRTYPKSNRIECDMWDEFQSMLNQNYIINGTEVYR